MENKKFIAITEAYLQDDGESVYTPFMWEIVDDENDCYGPCMELSEEGYDFVSEWSEDYSLGYDLCNGRAKGLAARFSPHQVWHEIVQQPDYRIGAPADF